MWHRAIVVSLAGELTLLDAAEADGVIDALRAARGEYDRLSDRETTD